MDPAEQVRGQRPWVAVGAQQGAVARSLGSLQPARASEEERETSTGKAAEPRAAVPGWCKAGIRVKECEVGPSGPGCQVMGVRRSSGVRGRGAATPYKCQHEESSRPRPCADIKSSRPRPMDGYEGESGKVTFYDDSVGSFERDLVYALDAGVRHTVNVALDKATQTIKHLLMGFTDQQGWVPHCSSQEELPFSQDPSGSSSVANPHQADLNKL
ncbi:hypothetical protein NDU88_001508 [Pleurodeles waltl]|uniref:Uncharacterized protein n=1 Tax=Pleurodeles waltl TaxID=8319 RepID=A0AAV7Q415_PLEWA|nr:hypothetical protein NDU88_001498 [Pleurodeles waltl]KAJ1135063.1 hypothetical protein NDU88_001508 [Pleurodeles waltl]